MWRQSLKSKLSFLKRMKNDKRQVLDLGEESSYNVHEAGKEEKRIKNQEDS